MFSDNESVRQSDRVDDDVDSHRAPFGYSEQRTTSLTCNGPERFARDLLLSRIQHTLIKRFFVDPGWLAESQKTESQQTIARRRNKGERNVLHTRLVFYLFPSLKCNSTHSPIPDAPLCSAFKAKQYPWSMV